MCFIEIIHICDFDKEYMYRMEYDFINQVDL